MPPWAETVPDAVWALLGTRGGVEGSIPLRLSNEPDFRLSPAFVPLGLGRFERLSGLAATPSGSHLLALGKVDGKDRLFAWDATALLVQPEVVDGLFFGSIKRDWYVDIDETLARAIGKEIDGSRIRAVAFLPNQRVWIAVEALSKEAAAKLFVLEYTWRSAQGGLEIMPGSAKPIFAELNRFFRRALGKEAELVDMTLDKTMNMVYFLCRTQDVIPQAFLWQLPLSGRTTFKEADFLLAKDQGKSTFRFPASTNSIMFLTDRRFVLTLRDDQGAKSENYAVYDIFEQAPLIMPRATSASEQPLIVVPPKNATRQTSTEDSSKKAAVQPP